MTSIDRNSLQMFGNRFRPLSYNEMTAEQRQLTENVLSGDRGTMAGPYNVLLRSPIMGDLAQRFGAHMRFHSSLPKRLNELAILMTARYWSSEFEWYTHHQFALKAGLNAGMIDALARRERPAPMQADEEAVFNFCEELLTTKFVSDPTFHSTKAILGEAGIVDLIGVLAYYHLVSMVLNVDGYPLPENASPEFMLPKTR